MKYILVYDPITTGKIPFPIQYELTSLGFNAKTFDYNKYFDRFKGNINRVVNRVFYKQIKSKINKDLLDLVKKNNFEILLVCYGKHLNYDTLKEIKKYIPIIINWNSDDLFNTLNNSVEIIRSIPLYDIHFTPRIHLKNEYFKSGAKRVIELDWYYRSGYLNSKINYNQIDGIYFAGSFSKRRDSIISNLVHPLISISGSGWRSSGKYNSLGISTLSEMHYNFSSYKYNVNILTKENRDTSNLRNFEIPASFGFQISERTEKIESLFKENKEIVFFDSIEDLNSKIQFYSKNENYRLEIIKSAHKRLLKSDYSLKSRLFEMMNHVKNFS